MKSVLSSFLCAWTAILLLTSPASEASAATEKWLVMRTVHTILLYRAEADLEKFDKAVRGGLTGTLKTEVSPVAAEKLEERVKVTIDTLYEKAQKILDMRKRIRPVKIRLFSNADELAKAYQQIFKKPGHLRGWYLFEKHTVYIQADDVFPGMVAHELAHSIIDHYLKIRPPRATAEILARYVDAHLFDEKYKKYD